MGFQSLIPSGLVCQGPWKTIIQPGVCVLTNCFYGGTGNRKRSHATQRARSRSFFPMCLITGLLMFTVQRTEVFLHLLAFDPVA